MNGFEYVAGILKAEGVEWMACFPSNPLIEAAAAEGIRPIAFRHERGAVMAADGFSRVSDRRRFGVVAMQSQAGAENSLGGLAQAGADNVPILVLPEGNPLDRQNVRPNFSAARTWGPVVKRAEVVTRGGQIGAAMRRAFHALRNGRPGPVVVELTSDVCEEPLPEAERDYSSPAAARYEPAKSDVEAAAEALLGAREPLVWAGAGVLFARATAELRVLAELIEAPVYTSMPGKSAFDERHPLSVGAGGLTVTRAGRRCLEACDLLLAIGSSLTSTPYGQPLPPGRTLIHGVLNPEEINKDSAATIGLVGDAKLTLLALLEAVKARIGEGGRASGAKARVAAMRKEWMQAWRPHLVDDAVPISPYRVIHELNHGLDPENSVVTHDAGAPRDQMLPFFEATVPHSYVGWGKTTHLGFSIPMTIGVKLAFPDRFCLNLMGDAAFGMSGLDIETSARAGVPITTVVLNNGMMATYPGGFPTARERFGVSHMQGDYAALARAMGAEGIVVKAPGEVAAALARARRGNAEGRTVLIDVHTRAVDSRAPDHFV